MGSELLPLVPDNKKRKGYGLTDKIQTYVMAKEQDHFIVWHVVLDSLIYSLIYLEKVKKETCIFNLLIISLRVSSFLTKDINNSSKKTHFSEAFLDDIKNDHIFPEDNSI